MRLLVAFVLLLGLSQAQSLPSRARVLLNQGNSTVTKALLSYPSPFMDQPLWREAINYGLAAKKAAPTSPEPYGYLAKVYSYVKFYAAAWDAYQSFRAFGGLPDERQRQQLIELGRTLGYEAFARGEYTSALEYYLVAYHYAPDDQELNLQIARSYLGNNQADLASAYLRKLEGQHIGEYRRYLETANNQLSYGQSASNAYERGIKQYYLGNLSDARDSFAEATRLDPTFQKAFAWAGRVSLELSQPELALPYWQQAQALQPGSADMQYFLTLTQNQLRWGVKAYTAFEEGMALYNQGDMFKARAKLEEARDQNPTFSDAWAWLGRIAYEGADYQTAYDAFDKANQLANNETFSYFKDASARQLGINIEAVVIEVATLEQAAPVQEVRKLEAISPDPVADEAPVDAVAENLAEVSVQETEEPAAETEDLNAKTAAKENLGEDVRPIGVEASAQIVEMPVAETKPASLEENPFIEVVSVEPSSKATGAASPASNVEGMADQPTVSEVAPLQGDSPPRNDVNTPDSSSLIENDLRGIMSTEPLVLLSTYYTYEKDNLANTGAVTFFTAPSDLQSNWRTPANYAGGVVYQRLEVSRKPSHETVTYQLCLVPNDDIAIKPACSRAGGLEFSDIGVYTSRQPLSEFYQYDNIDWSRGISNLMVIVRDKDGNPVDSTFSRERGQDLNLYYPMDVRYSVVIVPEGGSFKGWP